MCVRRRLVTINLGEMAPHLNGDAGAATMLQFSFFMVTRPPKPQSDPDAEPGALYCPNCAEEVTDPLTCGDCSSVICRRCGTALESSDELGIG